MFKYTYLWENWFMANLYIISGCNGAGKTTASYSVLPDMLNCNEFVNADEIAKGLSPFQPDKVAIESGRIMLSRNWKPFKTLYPALWLLDDYW